MSTYDDFPACLPRYAWLVDEARKDVRKLYNEPTGAPPTCKVCGATVDRPDFKHHAADHRRQLLQTARQRERENVARLRQMTRLRAETRAATATPPPFVPGAQLTIDPEGDPNE